MPSIDAEPLRLTFMRGYPAYPCAARGGRLEDRPPPVVVNKSHEVGGPRFMHRLRGALIGIGTRNMLRFIELCKLSTAPVKGPFASIRPNGGRRPVRGRRPAHLEALIDHARSGRFPGPAFPCIFRALSELELHKPFPRGDHLLFSASSWTWDC